MCGIAGFNRAEGRSSIADGRRFARALALGIESRGRDATGFGWFSPTGDAMYWKLQGPAHLVAPRAPLDLGMRTLIAHTRFATQGSPSEHANNHPVIADGIVLTHNGVIDNDDELFATLGAPRVGKVDSEAIAALLSHGPFVLGGDVPQLLTLVEGDAALAWLDTDTVNTLHLARLNGRPLVLGWTRRGDLVYASTRSAMREAGDRVNLAIDGFYDVPEGTYLRIEGGNVVETQKFVPAGRSYSYSTSYTPKSNTTLVKKSDTEIDWDNLVPRRGWK